MCFSPRYIGAEDFPTIWTLPIGYSKSSSPKYQSLRPSVFWKRVSFFSLETARKARLLWNT